MRFWRYWIRRNEIERGDRPAEEKAVIRRLFVRPIAEVEIESIRGSGDPSIWKARR